jgi:hypothetical protein
MTREKILNPQSCTEQELKEKCKKTVWNGSYASKICHKCGQVWVNLDGHTDEAEIVERCRECFES